MSRVLKSVKLPEFYKDRQQQTEPQKERKDYTKDERVICRSCRARLSEKEAEGRCPYCGERP